MWIQHMIIQGSDPEMIIWNTKRFQNTIVKNKHLMVSYQILILRRLLIYTPYR